MPVLAKQSLPNEESYQLKVSEGLSKLLPSSSTLYAFSLSFFLIASILLDPSEASDNCMRCPLPLSIKEVKSVSEVSSVDL